jgi:hypothetical protein
VLPVLIKLTLTDQGFPPVSISSWFVRGVRVDRHSR